VGVHTEREAGIGVAGHHVGRVRTADENARSSFRLFCQAIGSAHLTGPITLNEGWAAVPLLRRVESLGAGYREAMRLESRGDDRTYISGPLASELRPPTEEATSA